MMKPEGEAFCSLHNTRKEKSSSYPTDGNRVKKKYHAQKRQITVTLDFQSLSSTFKYLTTHGSGLLIHFVVQSWLL